ncbi:MAG: ogr/Delta-like zinc finger family protein [gamma proteobacterium endosymbiont of Lamellibrachia anaximandri]|nr:ogr/Delta-like zinc finger family protein [gamma proteobacterium endosymbiont of Lamellibrachia anaximandri]
MKTKCPHCECLCVIRDSKQLSNTCREIKFQCQNIDCGFTFVSTLSADRTLSPSARPNPTINIPLSADVNRERIMPSMQNTAEE